MGSTRGGAAVAGQAELAAAVAALAAADVDSLSNEAALEAVRGLWPLICAAQAQVARRLGRIHLAGAVRQDGAVSTPAWLRIRLRVGGGAASALVKAGAGVGGLAETRAALQAGEISVEHAAVLADALAQLGETVLAGGVEKILLEYARTEPPAVVRRLLREIALMLLSEEDALKRQAALHTNRQLTASMTLGGAVSVHGLLDPVQGEALLAALAAYTAGPDPDGFAGRTPGQRRADALADICATALATSDRPVTGADRPHITVTVAAETLRRGLANLDDETSTVDDEDEDGDGLEAVLDPMWRLSDQDRLPMLGHCQEPVCVETARRLACDAGIIPVVLGSRGEPLDIGRLTRTVPTGLRRALELRDGGCRFPGCSRPASWCDAHHILCWARGGPTCLTNLVLLCGFHHTMVHEGQWTLTMHPTTGQVRVRRPDGTRHDLTSMPRGPTARR